MGSIPALQGSLEDRPPRRHRRFRLRIGNETLGEPHGTKRSRPHLDDPDPAPDLRPAGRGIA